MTIDPNYLTIAQAKQLEQEYPHSTYTENVQVQSIEIENDERPVLVITGHRGVFFGYAKNIDGPKIKLRSARNVVYWSKECRGFLGLAANGPDKSCRIGPAADIEIWGEISCIASVTDDAVKAFEAQPWGK